MDVPMRILLAACAALICGAASAAETPMNRDAQWIYRERNGDGRGEPSATFLSWSYTSVLFQARCQRSTHTVTLSFSDGPDTDFRKEWDRRPLTVVLGKRRVAFKTFVGTPEEPNALETRSMLTGTLKVTPAVLAAFTQPAGTEVSIEAPEEEYGEWFVGKAEPLRRLVKACA
jgi:hypothetical protein